MSQCHYFKARDIPLEPWSEKIHINCANCTKWNEIKCEGEWRFKMKELINDLLTNKYTTIFHEDENDVKFNAPCHFSVYGDQHPELGITNGQQMGHLQDIKFQEGPIKEHGINGVMNEDLIVMAITRLEHFQNSELKCRENALAITKLEEALLWLRKRTMDREKRGVEGTYTK